MLLRDGFRFLTGALIGFTGVVGPMIALCVLVLWMIWPRSAPLPRPVKAPADFPVRGIDVSHHQGRVDWAAVKSSGKVDFAFVKATEGNTHRDRRFRANWKAARANGVPVGAYHYLSLCRGGAEQAAHFIDRVPKEPDALPPVVDIEPDARCNRGSRLATAPTVVADWLKAVEAHYGKRPIVYTSAHFYRTRLASSGLKAHIWAAAYSREPRTGEGPWLFWQFTDRGWVSGVLGPVDQNVFRGSIEELQALIDPLES